MVPASNLWQVSQELQQFRETAAVIQWTSAATEADQQHLAGQVRNLELRISWSCFISLLSLQSVLYPHLSCLPAGTTVWCSNMPVLAPVVTSRHSRLLHDGVHVSSSLTGRWGSSSGHTHRGLLVVGMGYATKTAYSSFAGGFNSAGSLCTDRHSVEVCFYMLHADWDPVNYIKVALPSIRP